LFSVEVKIISSGLRAAAGFDGLYAAERYSPVLSIIFPIILPFRGAREFQTRANTFSRFLRRRIERGWRRIESGGGVEWWVMGK
jgi:hypothetical protein